MVRHGEKVKQIGDPPLSEKGVLQAKATAKHFKNLKVCKVISSPILRTKQTAQHIADELALDILIDDLLKERVNWGDDPNQSFDDFLAMWAQATLERDWVPPVGDSSRKAGERLQEIISSSDEDNGDIVLVTHGGIITDFLSNVFCDQILDAKLPIFSSEKDSSILECSITTIDYDPETRKYELLDLSSTKHLEEI